NQAGIITHQLVTLGKFTSFSMASNQTQLLCRSKAHQRIGTETLVDLSQQAELLTTMRAARRHPHRTWRRTRPAGKQKRRIARIQLRLYRPCFATARPTCRQSPRLAARHALVLAAHRVSDDLARADHLAM